MSGTLVAVSVSARRGGPKAGVASARLVPGHGIEGDAHAGDWDRQVSLLAEESIETIRALGVEAPPGTFAENLTVRGADLARAAAGDRVRVGPALLEITRVGKECHQRCAIFEAVGDCVMPREGLFARVLEGGVVRPGDPVEIETSGS